MHRSLLVIASPLVCLLGLLASTNAAADAPAKPAAEKAADKGWITLFDGKTFDGWKVNENKDTWKIENGELVTHGERSHLFYDGKVENHKFKNFDLQLDIMTKPNSNSGVYVHTKYQDEGFPSNGLEVQVNNSHPDPRKTASIYHFKDIMNNSPAKDNEWFTMQITLKDKHAVVKINDKVVMDYDQPNPPPHEKGWENNIFTDEGGTIALQGHDPGSEVHYRNIRIRPLP